MKTITLGLEEENYTSYLCTLYGGGAHLPPIIVTLNLCDGKLSPPLHKENTFQWIGPYIIFLNSVR